MSFQGELNRLAGTSGKAAQGAANTLAGTDGKELLSALNTIAGTVGKGLVYVMDRIAELNLGADNSDPLGAAGSIPTGAIIVGGLDTVVIGFSSAFTGKTTTFYDAAGTFY